MKTRYVILLGLVSVVAIGIAAYVGSQTQAPSKELSYQTYRNNTHGFSFLYPSTFSFRDSASIEQYGITLIGEFVNKDSATGLQSISEGGYPSVSLKVVNLNGQSVEDWVLNRVVTSESDVTAELVQRKGEVFIIPNNTVRTVTLKGHAAIVFNSISYLGKYLILVIQTGDKALIFTGHDIDFSEMVASLTFSPGQPEIDSTVLSQLTEAITSIN